MIKVHRNAGGLLCFCRSEPMEKSWKNYKKVIDKQETTWYPVIAVADERKSRSGRHLDN